MEDSIIKKMLEYFSLKRKSLEELERSFLGNENALNNIRAQKISNHYAEDYLKHLLKWSNKEDEKCQIKKN